MRSLKQQFIEPKRFQDDLSIRLRSDGIDTMEGEKPYCFLYRIEDRENYTRSMITKRAPKMLSILLQLQIVLDSSSPDDEDFKLAESAIEDIQSSYEDEFMLDESHPGVIYSPGSEHKLEYNLSWVCGVAQSNKSVYLLSLPNRRSFLRREDTGEFSAFAYELGALYKVGYRPMLNRGLLYMKPPKDRLVGMISMVKAVVPKSQHIVKVLNELQETMFPNVVRIGKSIRSAFIKLRTASTTTNKLFAHRTHVKKQIKQLKALLENPVITEQFKVATKKEYQDIILSVCVNQLAQPQPDFFLQSHLKKASLIREESISRDKLYKPVEVLQSFKNLENQLFMKSKNRLYKILKKRSAHRSTSDTVLNSQSVRFFSGVRKKAEVGLDSSLARCAPIDDKAGMKIA